MPAPTPEENPTGYHAHYRITKADGSPCDPKATYFVLRIDSGGSDPHHIAACRAAMRAYVETARGGPLDELASSLEDLLDSQDGVPVHGNPFPLPNQWPLGLEAGKLYKVACDDTGHSGGSWLRMLVDEQGDCYPAMQQWEDIPQGRPHPCPSIRIRTVVGGGKNTRTRLALLWLAQAIRLDNADQEPVPFTKQVQPMDSEPRSETHIMKQIEEGGTCPYCTTGRFVFQPSGECSCHISPPCSACENCHLVCEQCGCVQGDFEQSTT